MRPEVGVPVAGRRPDAVVFDCDGTIADTESISDQAWTETLATHGYQATQDDFRQVVGHPFAQNWAYFAPRAGLDDRQAFRTRLRARFIELFEQGLVVHEDAATTIRELATAGVPVAVASSSTHRHVERVLERAELTGLVGAIVGADDVTAHKPHPEPYLAAARDLGVDPVRCAAVEDTPVGVRAAVAAGMYTVAVVRSHGDAADLQEAHHIVDEVSVASVFPVREHWQREERA